MTLPTIDNIMPFGLVISGMRAGNPSLTYRVTGQAGVTSSGSLTDYRLLFTDY